jgi:hypothetical protein
MSPRYWYCRICSGRVWYVGERMAWVHVTPGADHGPIPTLTRPRVTA